VDLLPGVIASPMIGGHGDVSNERFAAMIGAHRLVSSKSFENTEERRTFH
jgi:hypothetical protein